MHKRPANQFEFMSRANIAISTLAFKREYYVQSYSVQHESICIDFIPFSRNFNDPLISFTFSNLRELESYVKEN